MVYKILKELRMVRLVSSTSSNLHEAWVSLTVMSCMRFIKNYLMASSCSRYDVHYDWLIEGHYSPVMSTGQLLACKNHIYTNQIIINLDVWS